MNELVIEKVVSQMTHTHEKKIMAENIKFYEKRRKNT